MDMIPGFVQKICESVLRNVEPYNVFYNKVRSHPQGFELQNNFYNERTVAHFFDVVLQNDLFPCYIISECAIPGKLVPHGRRRRLAADISCKNKTYMDAVSKNSKFYIPDTVIINDNVDDPVVFLEYKVDTKFTYYKLAIDYLKYKCYSSIMQCDSAFIYILFYKSSNNSGIVIKESKRVELDLKLSESDVFDGKSLFIFKKKDGDVWWDNISFDARMELMGLVGKADEVIEQIQLVSLNGNNEVNGNFCYKMRNSFGSQVITAKRIVRNFKLLFEMDKKIHRNDYHEYDNNFRDDFYSFDFKAYKAHDFNESLCREISKHFNRQIDLILSDDKRSISEMYTLYNKRSLWILLMLRKFAIDMGWSDIADSFSFDVTDETIDKYTGLLDFAYTNNPGAFRKLCLGLLYYINKLYPLIFEIDDDVVISEKDFYLYNRYEQSLNKVTRGIIRIINKDSIRGFSIGRNDDQIKFAKIILDL